ncbi:MAG: HupE/UreJ family protein [Pseudomonadota bacterium]
MLRALISLFLIITIFSPAGYTHNKSVSYSDWIVSADGDVTARVRVPARQATLLLGDSEIADGATAARLHFEKTLQLSNAAGTCALTKPAQLLRGAPDMIVFELHFQCLDNHTENLTLESDAFYAFAGSHMHFVRVRDGHRGLPTKEAVLTADLRKTGLTQSPESGPAEPLSVLSFFKIGVVHILTGWDHLVFICGLLLITRSTPELFFAVTGFTIGHSLSLVAATAGLVVAQTVPVEVLIAYSIWLLGLDALLKDQSPRIRIIAAISLTVCAWSLNISLTGLKWSFFWIGILALSVGYLGIDRRSVSNLQPFAVTALLTSILGLAHGFGFASGLQEAFNQTQTLAGALIAFNLGVEIGQLLFLVGLSALLFIVKRLPKLKLEADFYKTAIATGVVIAGAFWFSERALISGVVL